MIFFSQWNEEHFKVFQKLRHDIFMIFRKKNSLTDSVRFKKKNVMFGAFWSDALGCQHTLQFLDQITYVYIT